MEKAAIIGSSLSDVRVTMVIMHVLVVELLCQVVTGQILALECLLPGAHECMRLHLVLPGIKWPRYSRTLALKQFCPILRIPPGMATEGPGA
jgi:hypothetical protein